MRKTARKRGKRRVRGEREERDKVRAKLEKRGSKNDCMTRRKEYKNE